MKNHKLRTSKLLLTAGMVMLTVVPGTAFAHDNLGGDELSMANLMLVGAIITIALGVIWGIWALNNGQFNNVEESKYRMIDLADDYDKIMAEAEQNEEFVSGKPATPTPQPQAQKAKAPAVQHKAPTEQQPVVSGHR